MRRLKRDGMTLSHRHTKLILGVMRRCALMGVNWKEVMFICRLKQRS